MRSSLKNTAIVDAGPLIALFDQSDQYHQKAKQRLGSYRDEVINKPEIYPIECEPLFSTFIQALTADAVKRPKKLRTAKEVWNKEWLKLLKGVTNSKVAP